ncbi:hypothetical protein ACEPAH_7362 [Sanghuangporus vaninii]
MSVRSLYREACKWFALTPPIAGLITRFFDAPFGRFTLSDNSRMLVDGNKSWIIMEIVCPITFVATLIKAPLSQGSAIPPLSLSLRDPRTLLSLLFLIHYVNRALIYPLRSPPRSKAHICVPLAALFFQTTSGSLLGTYFSSPEAYAFLNSQKFGSAFSRPSFWLGITFWFLGWTGNVLHDEILMDIRRDALKKKQELVDKGRAKSSDKPHYGIPRGYLYHYISYPNYFCEWIEWAGFSLAAAPFPSLSYTGFTTAYPPWLFFFSLVFVMWSRAYRGHQWYLSKFPDYPKERRAVIPFIL